MSAPDTNVEKQAKKHGAPLMGIALAVGTGILAIAAWLIWSSSEGQTPREATPESGVIAPEGN